MKYPALSRRALNRWIRLIIFSSSLVLLACGGNGDGSSGVSDRNDGSSALPPVSAATLNMAYGLKHFLFTWSDVEDASHYKLLENPDGISGFNQVGADITAGTQAYSLEVALYQRVNSRYILQSCNDAGCSDSGELAISEHLVGAIGYFKASNTGDSDTFGYSVSLSGDGYTLAVGAYGEDSNTTGIDSIPNDDGNAVNSGAAYVFTRSDGNWRQQAYIKAANTGGFDNFGWSVSLSGDGNTLAVGARYESSNTTGINSTPNVHSSGRESGAAYVFTRTNGSWTQQAYIKAHNTGTLDNFGDAVSLSSDGNTLAVGAHGEDSNTTGIDSTPIDDGNADDSGAAYVFTRTNGNWTQQAYIKASNTGAYDWFGWSLSLSGSGNTLAVGSRSEDSNTTTINSIPNDDGSADNSGATYVFIRTNGNWSQQAYIKASNTGGGDEFGRSVSLSSDGQTLAVGALGEDSNTSGIDSTPNDDGNASNSGAAYVFARTNGNWSQQAYIKAHNTGSTDLFGIAVSLSHDGNTLAIGAYGEDSDSTGISSLSNDAASNSGAGYIFTRMSGSWSQQAFIKAHNPDPDDHFGSAVSLSGDGTALAIGAPDEDSNTTGINSTPNNDLSTVSSGAVYLY